MLRKKKSINWCHYLCALFLKWLLLIKQNGEKNELKLASPLLSSIPKQQRDHRKLRGCYVENTVLHQTGDQTRSVSFYSYGK